jgi:hypothetical protein
MGGWVDPRAGLDDVEKILEPTGTRNSDPSVVQDVASRYTDYAIPTLSVNRRIILKWNLKKYRRVWTEFICLRIGISNEASSPIIC